MGIRLEFTPDQAEDDLAIQLGASAVVQRLGAVERHHHYVPGRRFEADIAIPSARLLIEVQGGIYTRQAHGSVSGVLRDNERLNLATLHGWAVLRFTPEEVGSGVALTTIEEYLARRGEGGRAAPLDDHPPAPNTTHPDAYPCDAR
ncbi:MAG: hypothetical protein AB7L91_06355 [Dehalococcoidia bacterium]